MKNVKLFFAFLLACLLIPICLEFLMCVFKIPLPWFVEFDPYIRPILVGFFVDLFVIVFVIIMTSIEFLTKDY